MSIKGIEQGRAAFAFEKVEEYVSKGPAKNNSEYCSYIKKMPSMIQVNGLGQTLAFFFSKGGVHRDIYNQVADWAEKKYPERFGDHMKGEQAFVESVIHLGNQEYRLLTMEVLALLNWMRRFVEGMVKEPEKKKADGE